MADGATVEGRTRGLGGVRVGMERGARRRRPGGRGGGGEGTGDGGGGVTGSPVCSPHPRPPDLFGKSRSSKVSVIVADVLREGMIQSRRINVLLSLNVALSRQQLHTVNIQPAPVGTE